jgi:hypothetical protein
MGISMNPRMSGFRKWAEMHEPTKIDKNRTGANKSSVIGAADVHRAGNTPDQQPHRPWLVPGAGTL